MSKLKDLIAELCPHGVEFKKLGEIAEISAGGDVPKDRFSKNKDSKYKIPVVSNGVGDNAILGFTDISKISKPAVTVAARGTIGCAEYRDYQYFPVVRLLTIIPIDSNFLNTKYLYYCLQGKKYNLPTGGIPQLTIPQILEIKIPVPPLPVQAEIVRILDTFTALITELTTELKLRKKQYEYYRDKLLTFDNVEYKRLGELFEFKNGLNKEKAAFGKGKPIINFMDVYKNRWLAKGKFFGLVDVTEDEISRYNAKKGDIFFTRTSETKEDIGMSSTLIEDVPDCVFSGFVLRARPKTNLLNPKFCSYYFSTPNVRSQIIRYSSFTTRATTTGEKLSKIKIPVPPIEEQERIVNILDKFDKLCNDLREGIPAEIALRQKQYEYYRDKLLTFEDANRA